MEKRESGLLHKGHKEHEVHKANDGNRRYSASGGAIARSADASLHALLQGIGFALQGGGCESEDMQTGVCTPGNTRGRIQCPPLTLFRPPSSSSSCKDRFPSPQITPLEDQPE